MARYRLNLLGGFSLWFNLELEELRLPTVKSKALLAYLALTSDQVHSRDELAALFWGDRPESAARHNLAQTLSSIRKVLSTNGTCELHATRQDIVLDGAEIESDVSRYECLLAQDTLESLAEADLLYRGDLLAGFCDLGEDFDMWLRLRRQHLSELRWNALAKLFALHRDNGSPETAVKIALRLLELDPLAEEMHRELIGLYLQQGRKAAAKRQYEACVKRLRHELDVEPEAETTALYLSISGDKQTAGANITSASGRVKLPSIAVLPFDNLGLELTDAGKFRDLEEGIRTELTRLLGLRVISKATVERIERDAPVPGQIGQDGIAKYIITGTVKRHEESMAISLQLVEAATGQQLWAERFQPSITEYVACVRELPTRVARALLGRLEAVGVQNALRSSDADLDAYGCYMRGRYYLDQYDRNSVIAGRRFMELAVKSDPGFASAQAFLAWFVASSAWWESNPDRYLDEALVIARKAEAIDPYDGHIRGVQAFLHLYRREFREAETCISKALSLSPELPLLLAYKSQILDFVGRPKEGLKLAQFVLDEFPHTPNWHLEGLGLMQFSLRHFDKAIEAFNSMDKKNSWNHLQLAACYGQIGETDAAQAEWRNFSCFNTDRSPENLLQEFYENPAEQLVWLEGLNMAGLSSSGT